MLSFCEIKALLSQKCVGIAGAGGLGSNCAQNLVRCGIGKLIIADFDTVNESNLNRQFYFKDQVGQKKVYALRDNLNRINNDSIVQIHDCVVNTDNIPLLYSTCDVVVEAFDSAESKHMLIEYMCYNYPNIPLVSASGLAGFGSLDKIHVVESGNLFVCGDFESQVEFNNPPLGPKVSMVSAMQADIVLQILLKY